MTVLRAAVATLLVGALLVACSSAQPPGAAPAARPDLARELVGKVTLDAMFTHLHALQAIADTNQGTRADGTPGFDASVDYVAKLLRDSGFDVQAPDFNRVKQTQRGNPSLTVAGRSYPVDQASLLMATGPGGLSARTQRPERPAGCVVADYGAVNVKGAIAVVDDTGCSVVDKQNTAVAEGAVAVLVVSTPGDNGSPRGLFIPGYYEQLKVPVGVISAAVDAAVLDSSTPVDLVLDGKSVVVKSRNLLAQTKSGDTHNVVMVGAHLDSAPGSAGLNDNGTGVAAVLATALALGSAPSVTNAVRFAFWGAEDSVEGSARYVSGLDRDGLNDIALYLNFDMLGSPNAGFFAYDGEQSGTPNPAITPDQVPVGSAGLQRTLAGYLNLAGIRPADMTLGANTDYNPFMIAGVPIGGMTTGATGKKTQVQARLWGGRVGVAFDPNYQSAQDTIVNVNAQALAMTGPAVAFVVGTYAQSTDGVNGVPPHDNRSRARPGS
jgi:Zn-dependent M28 family amino/carboxypeptidase